MKRPRLVVWLHEATSSGAWCARFHAKTRTVRAWLVPGRPDGSLVMCSSCGHTEARIPELPK